MLDSVRFPSWVHRLYLFSRATVNNAWPRFCQKVYDKSSYFTTPDPIDVNKNHLHHEVVRSFLEWSCQISRMASSASLFTYAKVWRMGVVLYCHTTSSSACLPAPRNWPDPHPKQNRLLYLSHLPNDQRPVGVDIGSPYWRKAIDLNDRRRLL